MEMYFTLRELFSPLIYSEIPHHRNVILHEEDDGDVQNIFIFQNTKDVKISIDECIAGYAKQNISCLRCRKLFEHAQKQVKELPAVIDRHNTISICDHCKLKILPDQTCDEFHHIVKKFMRFPETEDRTTSMDIDSWLAEGKDVTKLFRKDESLPQVNTELTQSMILAKPINELCKEAVTIVKEPMIKQFYSDAFLNETKRTVNFEIDFMKLAKLNTDISIGLQGSEVVFKTPQLEKSTKSNLKQKVGPVKKEDIRDLNRLSPKRKTDPQISENKDGTKKSIKTELSNVLPNKKEEAVKDKDISSSKITRNKAAPKKGVKTDFSYVFPKKKVGSAKLVDIPSSELIKKTREKFAKKGKEFENQPKLEEITESELKKSKEHSKAEKGVKVDTKKKEVAELSEPVQTSKEKESTNKKKRDETTTKTTKVDSGIIKYKLSDRTFIDNGWTILPTEKVVRKVFVYKMHPAHPEFDWFEHHKNKREMHYDSGEKLANFDEKGRGRLYYKSGRLALDYYDAKESNAQQRFVVYSSGEPDERGRTHPITILATFDHLGNGIVFDHSGKIRLKYNQTEGVVLDRGIGPVSHWKWHTLNDPPVLQQVMINTQMSHKDPTILQLGRGHDRGGRPENITRTNANADMLAIEFDNFIKEKSNKQAQAIKSFQIKMKALKINEHFSLKVLDQASVYLIFRDGSTNIKLNMGMILDPQEIVDTDTAEVGDVSTGLERLPPRTESLAELQRSVAYAQHYETARSKREHRICWPKPVSSADKLISAVSRPRSPLTTFATKDSTTNVDCCRCMKPSSKSNVYYNNRLI